ncbi:NAD(P)H-binding protein [Sphaerisporangium sp. TRM90804]|uniref:NAD(P)H-binding protein n=1 Tax=Sphaerisporangium sp. TRM90804 TaxID=3031113 RepID=UPI00244D5782|nr:NAD(P)H-binding protein [Sphaerisporangium sp. TRM90804]MDH2428848.1 NAD(P)H-binding protein [Sphaerisporangium sp. TRM90804]
MTEQTKTILVLGGTGKTGRRVVERLAGRGLRVRAGSRAGTPPFDWEKPETWPDVVRGADAVYVTYQPDLAFPGAAESIRAFAELAARGGTRRLVLLSGRGEEAARVSEQGVRDSGVPEWTVLRASFFAQNFSEDFLLDPVREGLVALPAGEVAEPFVDVADVADVAVEALTRDGHAGQVYELTGPRLLTLAEAAATIGEAAGREVAYLPVTPERYRSTLTAQGVPEDYAAFLADLFGGILDGRNAHLDDGVQRVLGRAPRDFADYVKETAATGVWTTG